MQKHEILRRFDDVRESFFRHMGDVRELLVNELEEEGYVKESDNYAQDPDESVRFVTVEEREWEQLKRLDEENSTLRDSIKELTQRAEKAEARVIEEMERYEKERVRRKEIKDRLTKLREELHSIIWGG